MTQRSTHENQIRGSVLGMRGRRKLRSPTDHPELREQRAQLLRTRTASIPFTVCVCVFDPLCHWKISTVGRFDRFKIGVKAPPPPPSWNFARYSWNATSYFEIAWISFIPNDYTLVSLPNGERKVSTSLILSQVPFPIFLFPILQISSTTHIACEKFIAETTTNVKLQTENICFRLIPRIYLLNIFNIDNDVRWDS